MLTKAFIKSLPTSGDNCFKVRVPLYEDNTANEAIFDAYLCSDPSNYNGYSVGDTVYVEFEDEHCNTAVILGKLYVDTPTNSTSYNLVNELKVTDYASLPPTTKLGDYTAQDIINLYNGAGQSSTVVEKIDDSFNSFVIHKGYWVQKTSNSGSNYYSYILTADTSIKEGYVYSELLTLTGDETPTWDIVVDPEDTSVDYKTQIKYRAWCTTLTTYYKYMELLAMGEPEHDIVLEVKGLNLDEGD